MLFYYYDRHEDNKRWQAAADSCQLILTCSQFYAEGLAAPPRPSPRQADGRDWPYSPALLCHTSLWSFA